MLQACWYDGWIFTAARQQASASIESLIAKGTPIDGVLCMTDACALGAIDALKAADRTPNDVFIVSANDEDVIANYIKSGYYVRASVPLSHSDAARLTLNAMVKALAGSPVPEYLSLTTSPLPEVTAAASVS